MIKEESSLDLTATVLISGTTSGLGLALLGNLYPKVGKVHCFNRRRDAEIEARFPNAEFHVVDIVSREALANELRPILNFNGKFFVFLNAAINLIDNSPRFNFELFKQVVDTNLYGYSNFVGILESTSTAKVAQVVCIGSTSTMVPNYSYLGYFVSKFAVENLILSLQKSKTTQSYKLVIMGPLLSRMAANGNLSGLKKIVFENLALTPDQAAARISRFAQTKKSVLRLTWPAFLFYFCFSIALKIWFKIKPAVNEKN